MQELEMMPEWAFFFFEELENSSMLDQGHFYTLCAPNAVLRSES